jgi:hypothetical protein
MHLRLQQLKQEGSKMGGEEAHEFEVAEVVALVLRLDAVLQHSA